MRQLIAAIIDIALHRRGPDHLPSSGFLLALMLAAYLVTLAFALRAQASLYPLAVAFFAGNTAAYLLYCRIVLQTAGRASRFRQTASALLGADTLFNVLAIPLSVLADSALPLAGLPLLLLYILFFWSVDVAGFVISRAIDRPYIVGVLIVVAYVIAAQIVQSSVLPVANS